MNEMLELIKPSYSAVKSVNGKIGIVELTAEDIGMEGMATEEFVIAKIAEAQLAESDVDLSGYYTKSETDKKIDEKIAAIDFPETDLTNYATKNYVQTQVQLSQPDLTDYATKKYVSEEILKAQLEQGEVDLSNYYTKSEADAAVAEDLKPYALKSEIPSTTGLASESYVDQKIAAIPGADLSNYYTKSEVDAMIPEDQDLSNYALKSELPTVPTAVSAFTNDAGYQTAAEVTAAINEALGVIENGTY